MESNILKKLNLNNNEILVYEELLTSGEQKAVQISKKVPLKRGLLYKTLEDLERKGLIIREDAESKISTFTPIHPNVLKGLAENQLKQAQDAQNSLQSELGSLVSMYNLANNKPGVEFYEGFEGIEKVLNDTLTSKTDVYTYSDIYHTGDKSQKINHDYVKKRINAQIHKKIITPSSNKKLFSGPKQEFTEVRFLENDIVPFKTAMQIYDGKVSYQTLNENNVIAVLIEDENIYSLHKGFFEATWENLLKSN